MKQALVASWPVFIFLDSWIIRCWFRIVRFCPWLKLKPDGALVTIEIIVSFNRSYLSNNI